MLVRREENVFIVVSLLISVIVRGFQLSGGGYWLVIFKKALDN